MESCWYFNKNVLLTSKILQAHKIFYNFLENSPLMRNLLSQDLWMSSSVSGEGDEKYALREARLDLNCISAIIFSLINKSEAQWRRNCGEGAVPNRHKSSECSMHTHALFFFTVLTCTFSHSLSCHLTLSWWLILIFVDFLCTLWDPFGYIYLPICTFFKGSFGLSHSLTLHCFIIFSSFWFQKLLYHIV
jgi:hypothetical protein